MTWNRFSGKRHVYSRRTAPRLCPGPAKPPPGSGLRTCTGTGTEIPPIQFRHWEKPINRVKSKLSPLPPCQVREANHTTSGTDRLPVDCRQHPRSTCQTVCSMVATKCCISVFPRIQNCYYSESERGDSACFHHPSGIRTPGVPRYELLLGLQSQNSILPKRCERSTIFSLNRELVCSFSPSLPVIWVELHAPPAVASPGSLALPA